MADKKLEKALYGPSMTEVALGAVLGLIVGVLAACVYLVFKPVSQVKELPKEVSRSVVYYIPGNEGGAKSKNWQAKQKQFLSNPTFSLSLVEEELNAWAATLAVPTAPPPPPPAKPGAKPAAAPADAPKPATDGIFNPGRPNFKVVDGKLQIGGKCLLNWYGLTYEITVVTTGTFKKSGDSVVYLPDTVYLGSCPVHLLPAVSGPLMSHLISRVKVPDEIHSAWAKLASITIEGTALKFVAQ
ncbi:hypothetical protein [Opitutus sp. GAS368]|uniref:hypothetical protein n=1 Tax=Opitutus sp. GAS368 TaxID=1882749 RepID=UPI00087B7522|nr:hypothetical protein [Opitutus sp. GAS368]SDR66847.1 hypothetical protein SAMN05444173_0238 [Opitutus sp. GAS368]